MKRFPIIRIAGCLVASAALMSAAPTHAQVRVCTFPGSPSESIDRTVALEVFRTANIPVTMIADAIGKGDDDGVTVRELNATLLSHCDAIAGFPRSIGDGASGAPLLYSNGYLSTAYVAVTARGGSAKEGPGADVLAATYGSPAQLIAVREHYARLALENTSASTLDAVADGRAARAIVWYPAVVAYERAHSAPRFDVDTTHSPYTGWRLAFAFAPRHAALRARVDSALAAMSTDGRLAALTRDWALPQAAVAIRERTPIRLLAGVSAASMGRFIKVSATAAPAGMPSFDRTQTARGKRLYASACAKCHGANLEGVTGPALRGPAFAPAANSHLTVSGIFAYMSTNMPADRPGKLKPQEYADIMAYLLSGNGYRPDAQQLTADIARASQAPLNAGPAQ